MMLYLDPNYGDTPWLWAPSHCGVQGSVCSPHFSVTRWDKWDWVTRRECRALARTPGPCPPILMELCVWKMGIVESVTVRSLSLVTHSETRYIFLSNYCHWVTPWQEWQSPTITGDQWLSLHRYPPGVFEKTAKMFINVVFIIHNSVTSASPFRVTAQVTNILTQT